MNCFYTTGAPCVLASSARSDLFEIHVTIAPEDAAQMERFLDICAEQRWKAIVIGFDGAVAAQPMTCARVAGTPADAHASAQAAGERLRAAGLAVSRLKIEAAPWNSHVPQTDDERRRQHPSAYFEHHAKLRLPATGWQAELGAICAPFNAHISRNAFRQHADGWVERFATIRDDAAGRASFEQRMAQFDAILRDHGFAPIASVSEYCIYDSNAALDDHWLSLSDTTAA